MSHHYHHHHGASGHRSTQHQQHLRNLTHYPAAPSASPTPTPTAPDHIRSRSNPGALASTSGVILHQPYPNSVGIQSAQAQYAQPTPSSSAVAPPPPIPTHTRPVDMPVSPVRPGSTHYGVSLHSPASAPWLCVEHQWNVVGSFLALPVLAPAIDDSRSLHALQPPHSYTLDLSPRRRTVPKLPRPPKVASERE